VGEVFLVKFFSQGNEDKLNQGHLKNSQEHNVGIPLASLYTNKNLGLQIFKILFL
jgi:hypothetical protein